jgi:hypothetical protein
MKPKLARDGATGADKAIHQTISKFIEANLEQDDPYIHNQS